MTIKIQRPRLGTEAVEGQTFKLSDAIISPALPATLERLCTVKDWALALCVSVPTIERLRHNKKIPPPDVMIGRLPRWRPSTIRAWIESGGQP